MNPTSTIIEDLRGIYEAAVRGVQPGTLLDTFDFEAHLDRPLEAYRQVHVVGAGKANLALAAALEKRLGHRIDAGQVTVPHGYQAAYPLDRSRPERIRVVEAGHPVPDEAGRAGAEAVLERVVSCTADDLLIVLISGGGSALWPAPAQGITLADVQAVTTLLLRSGADIHQMNTVRKHLSRLKGGRLVQVAAPASVLALVLSDVVGDDLAVIASGPTVPDPTTFEDAIAILKQREVWTRLPPAVQAHLERGRRKRQRETPKPGDPVFHRVRTHLLGTNADALRAARVEAERRGYVVRIVTDRQTGEAHQVGRAQARMLLDAEGETPGCLLWGGETTVTVTGSGKGGRNQEVALGAALELDGAETSVAFLSGGTDGIDGPTDAAGAWVTPQTVRLARHRGLNPKEALQNNDAYPFFDQLDQLLRPGPTQTNVMDLQVGLR